MITGDFKLKVNKVIRESENSVTISFKKPRLKRFTYKPGQFLTVIIELNGKTELRAYSLNTADNIDRDIAITVKKVDNGLVSKFMNENIKAGDKIRVLRPYGEFTYEVHREEHTLIMFGAGSGITPLMSIIKTALYKSQESKIILIYANRSANSIIFYEKLKKFEEEFPYRFHVLHILKAPDGKINDFGRRLTIDMVSEIFTRYNLKQAKNPSYYICGPAGFMDVVVEGLKQLAVANNRIFFERFTAMKPAGGIPERTVPAILEVKNGKKKDFTQVTVRPQVNILDALLDAGFIIRYSCGNGICGSCKTKMLDGKVCMSLNLGLTEEDKTNQYILPCVSYPVTERVTLQL